MKSEETFEMPTSIDGIMVLHFLLRIIFNGVSRLKYFSPQWRVSFITMIPQPGKDDRLSRVI